MQNGFHGSMIRLDGLPLYHAFPNCINSLPDDKILDWSEFKQIADDICKCIKNGKLVPYMVENIVRKGGIACYKQFLLFSQCFPHIYLSAIYL